MSRKGYIVVEGHGEVAAAQNLITRVSQSVELYLPWTTPRRWLNLHQWEAPRRGGVRAAAEWARTKADIGALMILRDEDDGCPKELAPEIGARLRALDLEFPTAYVLLHPEYEVLFLPCLGAMSDLGFSAGLTWDRVSWEARRGVKEWLSKQLPRGRSYKPAVNQLAMTRCIDLPTLRDANVPCFGSLERSLMFLREHEDGGGVYPTAAK